MKRVTIQAVRDAASRRKLEVVRKGWGDGHTCGCPLKILYLDAHPDEDPGDLVDHYGRSTTVQNWAEQEYDMHYVRGFLLGCDFDHSPDDVNHVCCRNYLRKEVFEQSSAGFQDGIAVRESLQPRDLQRAGP
jgi:hypothetical protein